MLKTLETVQDTTKKAWTVAEQSSPGFRPTMRMTPSDSGAEGTVAFDLDGVRKLRAACDAFIRAHGVHVPISET